MSKIHNQIMGDIEVLTLPLPEGVIMDSATYTASGRVLLTYRLPGDPTDDREWMRLGTLADDGSDLRQIFAGKIPWLPNTGGIRFMPFRDNKRILLGDWILECEPDLDHPATSALIPLIYPEEMNVDPGSGFYRRWTEIIIAPDNVHMAWTMLGGPCTGNWLAKLRREADRYTLTDIRGISESDSILPDPGHPGCVVNAPCRGGELKQFTRGGLAVTVAGSAGVTGTTDSVEQDLDGTGLRRLTSSPAYEETTMISEDRRYGIAMSTRFSPKTNFALLGLVPRPLGILPASGTTMFIYLYAVAGVRFVRRGNIGPILFPLDQPDACISLHDPQEDWVYYSPLSWKPDSTSVMWNEKLRTTLPDPQDGVRGRVRIARLLNQNPSSPAPAAIIPSEIPYGQKWPVDMSAAASNAMEGLTGTYRFAGPDGGEAVFHSDGLHVCTEYNGYRDGDNVWTGYERHESTGPAYMRYEAKLTLDGPVPGEMDLRLTFRSDGGMESPTRLSFAPAEDGKPETCGFARYGDTCLRAEDMSDNY